MTRTKKVAIGQVIGAIAFAAIAAAIRQHAMGLAPENGRYVQMVPSMAFASLSLFLFSLGVGLLAGSGRSNG